MVHRTRMSTSPGPHRHAAGAGPPPTGHRRPEQARPGGWHRICMACCTATPRPPHAMAHFKNFLRSGHGPTLFAAFLYFDFTFAIWVLNGAMAPFISESFNLSPAQKGFMVSVPIIAGALMRFPLGLQPELRRHLWRRCRPGELSAQRHGLVQTAPRHLPVGLCRLCGLGLGGR